MKKTMSERMTDAWTDGLISGPANQTVSQSEKYYKYIAQLVLIDCSLAALKMFIDRTGYQPQ